MDRRIRDFQTTAESVASTHFQVDYRLRPPEGHALEESTFNLLAITSSGSLKPVRGELGHERGLAAASVADFGGYMLIQESPGVHGLVTLAFPLHMCSERESLTGLLQLVGSGAEYSYTSEYWIERLTLPGDFVDRYAGPRLGIDGMRDRMGVHGRPALGLVLKPRHGVSLDTLVDVARDALIGGCDAIFDDVLLGDPDGEMSFRSRCDTFARLAAHCYNETNEKKSYFCNIAAGSPKRASESARYAHDVGADGLIVNAFTMGLGAIEDLVEEISTFPKPMPVITSNMAVALMARAPTNDYDRLTQTGMSEAVFAKLCRLAGVDGVHTGTVNAECYGEMEWNRVHGAIRDPMGDLPKSFAVAAGDLGLSQLWANVSHLGPDVIIEVTSGIYNYPTGPKEGARAFRSLVDVLDSYQMDDDAATLAIDAVVRKDKTMRELLDRDQG